jgi:hypothetical protein
MAPIRPTLTEFDVTSTNNSREPLAGQGGPVVNPISVSLRNKLSPPLRDFTSRGIQAIIKSRIKPSDMDEFLQRKLSEDNIDAMRSLLELDGAIYSTASGSNAEEVNYQKKRAFDMAMVAIYEEILTPQQAASLILSGVNDAANRLEKIAVLEYNFYYLNKDLSAVTMSQSEGVYVTDSIVSIYHSDQTRRSYQNLANAEEEIQRIHDDITPTNASKVTAVASDFNPKALARINGRNATVEGSNIGKYRFLLNYGSTSAALDRDLTRKYWAITSDGAGGTHGYYVRDGERIYLSGLASLSYYGLLSASFNNDYKLARDFLASLRAGMLARTIHY